MEIVWIPHKGLDRPIEGKRWSDGLKWCGDILLENLQLYISPEFHIKPAYNFDDLDKFTDTDIVVVNNTATSALKRQYIFWKRSNITEYIKIKDRPAFIAGVNGFIGLERCKTILHDFDAVAAVGPKLANEAKKYNIHTFFCPEGVDLDLFSPIIKEPNGFTIGWVGDSEKKHKNLDLVPLLGFKYNYQAKENYIPYDQMPAFYHKVNVLINLSYLKSKNNNENWGEGFCKPILEAAACGLPIVSTDTGIASEIIDREWIIQSDPKKDLQPFVKKLEILSLDQELRNRVGEKNRKNSMKYSLENMVKIYEDMFRQVRNMVP